MAFIQLTPQDQEYLNTLNKNVQDAINVRTDWLDAMAVRCSTVKLGEEIYDLYTGKIIGIVVVINPAFSYGEGNVSEVRFSFQVKPIQQIKPGEEIRCAGANLYFGSDNNTIGTKAQLLEFHQKILANHAEQPDLK